MLLMELFDEQVLSYREEVRDHHSGQTDMTLTGLDTQGREVGRIDYSVYAGQPHVQYMTVGQKRRGYGTALLRELQRRYPDQEIDLGSLTDEGAALASTMFKTLIPNPEVIALQHRLVTIKATLQDYQDEVEELPPEKQSEFFDAHPDWNGLYDEEREIEDRLRHAKPYTRIFK